MTTTLSQKDKIISYLYNFAYLLHNKALNDTHLEI